MIKRFYPIVSLLLWLILISGCATMQDRWGSVVFKNTRESYEGFIKEYPDNELAKEAKKRIEDPDYAFMVTCQIGAKEAFDGFASSYPSSEYAPAARSYFEFLKETKLADLKSYKRFIAQYPNHPFVMEARIAVPVLWLKERGNKIGVAVNINQRIDKGLFGGGLGNMEGVRRKVWQSIKKELDQEGIQAVLLDSLESSKITKEEIKEVVIADYSESYVAITPSSYTSSSSGDYYNDSMRAAGAAAGNLVGQILSDIFYNPGVKVISITVKRINDGMEYYSGFPTLSSSIGKINRGEALRAIYNNPSPILTIADLKGMNLSEPLVGSALRGDMDSVTNLLAKGANVNAKDVDGNTALNWAAIKGHVDIIRILLAKGAEVNAKNNNGDTALMCAVLGGNTETIELLLSKGAEVNSREYDSGMTALMLAAKNGRAEIAQVLLAKGAEVNAKSNDGRTALMYTAQSGHAEIVEVLLAKAADVNAKEVNYGYTALMSAAANGYIEIIEVLLSKGADVNAKRNDGVTALMSAAQNGHTKIVELMLSKGADINARDNCGQTALSLAAQNGHAETIRLLKRARTKK